MVFASYRLELNLVHYMLLSSGMTESEMVNLVDLSSRNHHARDEHSESLYYGSVL